MINSRMKAYLFGLVLLALPAGVAIAASPTPAPPDHNYLVIFKSAATPATNTTMEVTAKNLSGVQDKLNSLNVTADKVFAVLRED